MHVPYAKEQKKFMTQFKNAHYNDIRSRFCHAER